MHISPNPITSVDWPRLNAERKDLGSVISAHLSDDSQTEKTRDPNVEFYRTEVTPWLAGEDSETLSPDTIASLRSRYLEKELKVFNGAMYRMFDNFHDFKQQLFYLDPELSKKHFGFTLGFNEEIKVTDPDGVLTPAQHTYLTEKLNDRKPLKEDLRTHAKSVMTLVDHYTEKFGKEHTLNLEQYSKVIDYGQLFSRNSIGNFMDTIVYQIERNAPTRDSEHKPLVDVHA